MSHLPLYKWDRATDTVTPATLDEFTALTAEDRRIAHTFCENEGRRFLILTLFSGLGPFFEPENVFSTHVYLETPHGADSILWITTATSTRAHKNHEDIAAAYSQCGSANVDNLFRLNPHRKPQYWPINFEAYK